MKRLYLYIIGAFAFSLTSCEVRSEAGENYYPSVYELENKISDLEYEISDLESQLEEKDDEISDLESQLEEKDDEISDLETRIDDLESGY